MQSIADWEQKIEEMILMEPGHPEIKGLRNKIAEYRTEFEKLIVEAHKPLKTEDEVDRVEIIILCIDNDRSEALDAIWGAFRTKWPFKITIYENSLNTMNTSKIWNKLIKESTCPYVMLMDSDALPKEGDFLTPLMEVMLRHPDAAVVVPTAGGKGVTTLQEFGKKDTREEAVDCHISGYCMLFKKSIFEDVGYFDEDFLFYGQDSDWIERILERKREKIYFVRRSLVEHGRDGRSSIASKRLEDDGKYLRWIEAEYSKWLFDTKKSLRGNK